MKPKRDHALVKSFRQQQALLRRQASASHFLWIHAPLVARPSFELLAQPMNEEPFRLVYCGRAQRSTNRSRQRRPATKSLLRQTYPSKFFFRLKSQKKLTASLESESGLVGCRTVDDKNIYYLLFSSASERRQNAAGSVENSAGPCLRNSPVRDNSESKFNFGKSVSSQQTTNNR